MEYPLTISFFEVYIVHAAWISKGCEYCYFWCEEGIAEII